MTSELATVAFLTTLPNKNVSDFMEHMTVFEMGEHMNTWTYVAIGLVILVVWIFYRGLKLQRTAATNILLAKHTYDTADNGIQEKAFAQVYDIISKGSSAQHAEYVLKNGNPKEFFGFCALAFNELGVKPSIPGYQWAIVRNPFVAAIQSEKQIPWVQAQIGKKHGVFISI